MSLNLNGIRIEFHILQSFPVSCLNRDDLGSPKSAIVGGVPRARVSSQCWKRAVRLQLHELGIKIACRTKYVVKTIAEQCLAHGATPEQAEACGNWVAKVMNNQNNKDENKDSLLFLSDSEAEGIAEKLAEKGFVVAQKTEEAEQTEGKKKNGKKKDEEIKKLQGVCKNAMNLAHDGLDIALFGRMVANAPDMNVEAAASFAHAISTHRVDSEIDYFTAVDDLRPEDESGSAHIGSLEFNSATYYRYVSLDLGQLAKNLKTDDVCSAVDAFVKALFLAVPSARQATMAAATPWNYAIVTLRKGQRMQLPFNDAVRISAKNPDLVANSVEALKARFASAERMYGSLFGLLKKMEISQESGSVDDLVAGLDEAIQAL